MKQPTMRITQLAILACAGLSVSALAQEYDLRGSIAMTA